jgi:hypothetical protein
MKRTTAILLVLVAIESSAGFLLEFVCFYRDVKGLFNQKAEIQKVN